MTGQLFAFNVSQEETLDENIFVEGAYDPQEQVWKGANGVYATSRPGGMATRYTTWVQGDLVRYPVGDADPVIIFPD